MKLYFSPNTCSLAPHIILLEIGLPYELVQVDYKLKRLSNGDNYLDINPKGCVAALELSCGTVLTEGAVLVQYLADLEPEKGMAPANGTMDRIRLQEWLNFVATDIHAASAPLFDPTLADLVVERIRSRLAGRFDYLEAVLKVRPYLMGESFTIADAYLYTTLGWMTLLMIELDKWPSVSEFVDRVGKRPSVVAARKIESDAALLG